MQILKETGIYWRKRRLISKLSMDQSVKYYWTKARQKVWRLEEKLDKNVVCQGLCSTYAANTLPKKLWKCLETLKQEDK
jgi:tagatose-1,6-bisphosphate aldolase non-catalytic subunit AgaZ/GatZ